MFKEDDTSVATDDDGFIGVSDEYKNYANDVDRPLSSEAGRERLQEAKAKAWHDALPVGDVNRAGSTVDVDNPVAKSAAKANEKEQKLLERLDAEVADVPAEEQTEPAEEQTEPAEPQGSPSSF